MPFAALRCGHHHCTGSEPGLQENVESHSGHGTGLCSSYELVSKGAKPKVWKEQSSVLRARKKQAVDHLTGG